MPGDTISVWKAKYTLYQRQKNRRKPATDYIKIQKKTSSIHLYLGMIMMTMVCFRKLAAQAQSTVDSEGSPVFIKLLDDEYYFWVTTGLFPEWS